ncbi:hypothetical protein BH18ACI5_BH18ACI5_18720 [soil metagenome]
MNNEQEQLAAAIDMLAKARRLTPVMKVVRRVARKLTDADGITFVLRDGDSCYYAEESAITPLWKGKRFPLSSCISGWVMSSRQAVAIQDIYADSRIPHAAYRPTFVKSLAMVPVRDVDPVRYLDRRTRPVDCSCGSSIQAVSCFHSLPQYPMLNILLVDADADSALRNSQSLKRAGFHVDVAASGLECDALTPDVVVLSVPRLERSMMRVVSNGRPVPRIAISSEEHDGSRGVDFECAAVLIRPVMYDDLVRTVRRVAKAIGADST